MRANILAERLKLSTKQSRLYDIQYIMEINLEEWMQDF